MTEKSKNGQKRTSPYRKIAKYGCGFLVVIAFVFIGVMIIVAVDIARNPGWGIMGPGMSDYCTSISGSNGFKVTGYVVDRQGQPVDQAQVEIVSEGAKSCIDELTSYRTITTQNGEFSFDPGLFAYTNEFFISVNSKGCKPSMTYDDLPSSQPVTIIVDCATTSSQ